MEFARMNDEELAQLFQTSPETEHGRTGFDRLWARHQSAAKWMIRCRWDLVPRGYDRKLFFDDTLRRAESKLTTYLRSNSREVRSFQALLKRIVETAILDERRAILRQPPTVSIDVIAFRSQSYYPSPQRILEAKDRSRIISTALDALARDSEQGLNESLALRFHYLKGWTYDQIAQRVRKDVRTVGRWVHDGLIDLKRILEDHFGITCIQEL